MWRNFWQTRLQKRPKMKENSETGYIHFKKIPEPVQDERTLGAPPCQ